MVTQEEDSLLVSDRGFDIFWSVKRCLFLWVRCLVVNRYIWGLLMRKFDKVNARLSFSPKYCRVDAKKAIKQLVFMSHEAMSIFWGSKNVLNLV